MHRAVVTKWLCWSPDGHWVHTDWVRNQQRQKKNRWGHLRFGSSRAVRDAKGRSGTLSLAAYTSGAPTPNRVLAQDLDEPCSGSPGVVLCGFYGVHTYRQILPENLNRGGSGRGEAKTAETRYYYIPHLLAYPSGSSPALSSRRKNTGVNLK